MREALVWRGTAESQNPRLRRALKQGEDQGAEAIVRCSTKQESLTGAQCGRTGGRMEIHQARCKGRQCAPRFACAAVGSPSSISAEPSTRLEGLLRIDDALNPRTANMVNS